MNVKTCWINLTELEDQLEVLKTVTQYFSCTLAELVWLVNMRPTQQQLGDD